MFMKKEGDGPVLRHNFSMLHFPYLDHKEITVPTPKGDV